MIASFPHTPYQYKILRLALLEAYAKNKVFTRRSFAYLTGLPENRHTSAALDAMVADGLLCRMLMEFPDYRDRLVYSRPPESQNMEVLNAHWQAMRKFAQELYEWERNSVLVKTGVLSSEL